MNSRLLVFAQFLVLITGFVFWQTANAQDLPLQRVDKDTYTFSTRNLHLIQNFALEGRSYRITDDLYRLEVRALNKAGQTDSSITGNYIFQVNGKSFELAFSKGVTSTELALEPKQTEIKLQLGNSGLVKTKQITRLQSWPKVVLLLSFLLLTFAFRHQLARAYRKIMNAKSQGKE